MDKDCISNNSINTSRPPLLVKYISGSTNKVREARTPAQFECFNKEGKFVRKPIARYRNDIQKRSASRGW